MGSEGCNQLSEDEFRRRYALSVEDLRRLSRTSWPWISRRWFRSVNVVDLETYRQQRQQHHPMLDLTDRRER